MDLGAAVVTDEQPLEVVEPGEEPAALVANPGLLGRDRIRRADEGSRLGEGYVSKRIDSMTCQSSSRSLASVVGRYIASITSRSPSTSRIHNRSTCPGAC